MIEALDHISVAVSGLDVAASAYEALLGRPAAWREDAAGARHAWFQLGNMALDVVQAAGGQDEGLWRVAFATSDFDGTRRRLERLGASTGEPESLGDARLAVIDPAATHGVPLALAERDGSTAAPAIAEDCVHALDHVVINTPNPDRAVALYGARLGLDFRLDRSNPQWGSRLMFFRCGEAVVEIGARLGGEISNGPDRLGGLAWRVLNPEAAQARIAAAGFDVSEVRKGRKPGTAVFTVRSGVVGAPALMLSSAPGEEP